MVDNNIKFGKLLTEPTLQRLSEYLIILDEFVENNKKTISSSELAEIYSNNANQVRQDLFKLQNTGRVGHGYDVMKLSQSIRKTLGLNTESPIMIIGCGKMGSALAEHLPFSKYGMELVGIFDVDPKILGTDIAEVKVRDIKDIPSVMIAEKSELAALCVPASSAQVMADRLVKYGVRGILNFTRKRLQVPSRVYVRHSQFICSFMQFVFMSKNVDEI